MKDLPPDPPVYTPPPERWFDQHRHSGDGIADKTKTLNAMWLTLHDRMCLPLPKKAKTFSPMEREGFDKLSKRLGDSLMDVWRIACVYIKDEEPEVAFKNLLAAKGLGDE